MKYLFAIKDVKTGHFEAPVTLPSVPDLLRSLRATLRQHPENMLSQFPEDYQVFRLGTFDHDTGDVMPMSNGPEFIENLVNLVERKGGVQ